MSTESSSSSSSGVSFLSLLTLLSVGLKLAGFINWSWWWVLAPTWIPLAILLAVGMGIGFIYAWTKIK